MDRRLMRMVVVGVVAAVMLQCAAADTVHVVGGSTGWRIPSNSSEYSNWASDKTFMVGDILTFTFTTDQHTVLQVLKASYDACSSTNPVGNIKKTSPANFTLSSTGDHFYICTIGDHCNSGQKLAINVSTTATPPSSSAARPSSTAAPPPPNSSSSAVFDGFFVTMLCVVAMAFFL